MIQLIIGENMNYYIIAQLFGVTSFICGILMMITNKKRNVIIYNLIVNFANSMQYAFLGAFTGAMSLIVLTLRNVWFGKYKDNKIPLIYLILVILLSIIICIITYSGPISLLPCMAIIIFSYGIWQNDIPKLKIINIIVSVLGMTYDTYYMAYITATAQFLYIIIGIFSYRDYTEKKRKKKKIKHH